MQMNGADAMIQHAGLNVVSLLKYQSFYICFKTYMPHVLLMNIKYSARYVVPWLKKYISNLVRTTHSGISFIRYVT